MEQETIEDQTIYECDICENVFKSVNKLKVHYIHFHREKKYKCDQCGKKFPFKLLLNYHLLTCGEKDFKKNKMKDVEYRKIFDNYGNAKFKCCKCKKIFKKLCNMLQHIYRVHREKKHQCEKCSKKFTIISNLKKHLKNCDSILDTKTQKISENHVKKDLDYKKIEDKFQCCKCGKILLSSQGIFQHIHVFHMEKKHHCDKCGKKIAFLGNLNRHFKKCDGIFRTREELNDDIKKDLEYNKIFDDDGKINFQCCICGKMSKNIQNMHQYGPSQRKETSM